jgi:hypothetical protein
MGAAGQQAIDRRMVEQLATFIEVGAAKGLFTSENRKELRASIAEWVPQMRAALDPKAVAEQHRAKIAPHLAVFDVTHNLVAALSLLFQGWGRAQDSEVQIEAQTGPLLVGADELEDEQKLRAWQPIASKLFGHAALPPALQAEPVKKQLAAHAAAREALPGTTDGQVFRAAQSKMVTLRAQGKGFWERMHDLLDGEFGRGESGFAMKTVFGYERRLRGGGASRKQRVGEGPGAPTNGATGSTANS